MRKEVIHRIFGAFLLIVGVCAALVGIFSGRYILLPPSALDIFVGILYLRIQQAKSKEESTVTFFPHSGKQKVRAKSLNKTMSAATVERVAGEPDMGTTGNVGNFQESDLSPSFMKMKY